jgi:hypothetical protein
MTNKEKKLAILQFLDAKCKHHFREFLVKKAEEEASIAGAKQWDREHPDDGVGCFSGRPYNPDAATYDRQLAENVYKKWQEICDYALESLVE